MSGRSRYTGPERDLIELWEARDDRYRSGAGRDHYHGVVHSQEAVRSWRVSEARAIGSDQLAAVARAWVHPADR